MNVFAELSSRQGIKKETEMSPVKTSLEKDSY